MLVLMTMAIAITFLGLLELQAFQACVTSHFSKFSNAWAQDNTLVSSIAFDGGWNTLPACSMSISALSDWRRDLTPPARSSRPVILSCRMNHQLSKHYWRQDPTVHWSCMLLGGSCSWMVCYVKYISTCKMNIYRELIFLLRVYVGI